MRKSILVIDDDDRIAIQLEGIFGAFFDITQAPDAADGIIQASSIKPALDLLDVEMPDMNGCVVCRTLKTTHQTEQLPVIFISVHARTEDRPAGYAAPTG